MKYEHKELLRQRLKTFSRLQYPEAEKKYSWLTCLLDTYHTIDVGTSLELELEQDKRKQTIACHRGCFHCCLKPEVPITEPEIWGLSWWANEKLPGKDKESIASQLLQCREKTTCPFLLEKLCSVYPVRPIACRIFYIFGNPCAPEEDPWEGRRPDIWTHSTYIGMRAAMTLLPLFGITKQDEKMQAFQSGFMVKATRLMHVLDWTPMHEAMQKNPVNDT